MTSFAFELNIERILVAAAHTVDKRDQRTESALEECTQSFSNLSQLSTGTPIALFTYLMEACPR